MSALEFNMMVNTAYELQKSRGMRNRTHLIRQKEQDSAAREKKELAKLRKTAKKEKIMRQLAKPQGTYEDCLPTQKELCQNETKNSNHTEALEATMAALEAKEAEVAKAVEAGEEVSEEDLIFVEDFTMCAAKHVVADEWELVC